MFKANSYTLKSNNTGPKGIAMLIRSLLSLSLFCASFSASAATPDALEAGFVTPPDSAKPFTWWHWMNGNATKSGITKDLEAMKAVGLGGFQQFDISWGTPKGPVAYNSPEYHDLMTFAMAEASRLGLDVGFHNASGWSSTGGPWITPEYGMKSLIWSELSLKGGSNQTTIVLPEPELPAKNNKEKPKKSDFYRDIAVFAFPTPKNAAYRIKDWQDKGLTKKGADNGKCVPDVRVAPADAVISTAAIINLTEKMDATGAVQWTPPAGDWTVVRMGYAANGVKNHPASHGGEGLEVDKLARKASDMHWQALIEKVIANAKGKKVLSNIFIDSYEVGSANWTAEFEKEFAQRCGYDLIPRLLCVTGRVLDTTEATERVLWDLRSTVAKLMHQNYFAYFAEKCHANNLKLAIEPYGNGPFDIAATTMLADIPMAEGDSNPMWDYVVKGVTSGAHLSGRSIVGHETFTAMEGIWTDHPATYKQRGDILFARGINRFYFHTFVHQPWDDTVKPGMGMGGFGGNFHRNNTWYPKARAWMDYLARCQFVMQQGTFQADVLELHGDERGFNNFHKPYDNGEIPGLSNDLGGIDSLNNLSVEANGDLRVTYQGKLLNTRYKLLLLKRAELMTPEHVAILGSLADKGAKIFAPKPLRSPSFKNFAEADKKLQALVAHYWNGKLIREPSEFAAACAALTPDCVIPDGVVFNRHRVGQGDFYFLANQTNQAKTFTATFRVSGKQPELWNPLTGTMTPATNWKTLADGRTEVSLTLAQTDSLFVCFRTATTSTGKTTPVVEPKELLTVQGPWKVTFDPYWGAKDPITFDRLSPWNEHAIEAVKYYSGSATYKTTFTLATLPPQLVLDLGQVAVLARVTLNGTELGTLWKAPYHIDASKAAKTGENTLEIDVTNQWANRLIGDDRLPSRYGYGDAAYWAQLLSGQPIPSDAPKKTWIIRPSKSASKDTPLLPAGLIGPVRVLAITP